MCLLSGSGVSVSRAVVVYKILKVGALQLLGSRRSNCQLNSLTVSIFTFNMKDPYKTRLNIAAEMHFYASQALKVNTFCMYSR